MAEKQRHMSNGRKKKPARKRAQAGTQTDAPRPAVLPRHGKEEGGLKTDSERQEGNDGINPVNEPVLPKPK